MYDDTSDGEWVSGRALLWGLCKWGMFWLLVAALVAGLFVMTIGTSSNLEETKANACTTLGKAGYECVGYEGYQWGSWFGGPYGGARVWYTMRVKDIPSTIFTGFVQRWGDEYHIYHIQPVNKNMVVTQ